MMKLGSEKAAEHAAATKNAYYGHSVFGGGWYVGTKQELKNIGVVSPKKAGEVAVAAQKAITALKKSKQSAHGSNEGDLFRSYGPGKFDNYASAWLYENVLAWNLFADEEVGESQYDNYYALLRGPFDHPQLKKYKGAILFENSQGFVESDFFTSKSALDKQWKKIAREVEAEMPEEDY